MAINQDNHNEKDTELEATLEAADFDNLFTIPQNTDNARLLMTPGGEDPTNLYMRGDIPSKRTAIAFAMHETRCAEHDDMSGVRQSFRMLASLVGVSAKRAELVGDVLIGERRNDLRRRGIGDWIREKAGMGGDGGPE